MLLTLKRQTVTTLSFGTLLPDISATLGSSNTSTVSPATFLASGTGIPPFTTASSLATVSGVATSAARAPGITTYTGTFSFCLDGISEADGVPVRITGMNLAGSGCDPGTRVVVHGDAHDGGAILPPDSEFDDRTRLYVTASTRPFAGLTSSPV